MPTTSNFGWTTPADTDLVKDGASAIRTLGNGIDTSFVDLKGGTTGQVLAKASNTDLDFTWASDATGIPATIFDAKGDIIAATAADTASRLAVGANNTVLTADSTTATGLKWAAPSGGYTLISRQTFTSVSTITLDNIFSSTYDNYQIVLLFGNNNETADLNMKFRYGATPTTASLYYNWDYQINAANGGTSTVAGSEDGSSIRLVADTGTQLAIHMFISSFSDRLWGGYFATGYSNNAGAGPNGYRGNFNNRFARSGSDAYHGLYFEQTAGSASGSISIYGQAKS